MEPSPRVAALVRRAQEGERAAFDELVEDNRSRVMALVRSRLGAATLQPATVEDICQETFLRAFRSLDRFTLRDNDSFFRWLAGIAANVIHEVVRQRRQQQLNSGDGAALASDPSPSKVMRRDERFHRLERALRRLSRDHRQVIRLARIEKLPLREVAERMERSETAVRSLLWRALDALRENFGQSDTGSLALPARPLRLEGDSHGK